MARSNVGLVPLCLFLASACASPVQDLWPAQPEGPSHAIIVSLDTWHAMIAFPLPSPQPSPPDGAKGEGEGALFEEWGYAEQAWYLEGRQGLTGILRALFGRQPASSRSGAKSVSGLTGPRNLRRNDFAFSSARKAMSVSGGIWRPRSGEASQSRRLAPARSIRPSAPTICSTTATSTPPWRSARPGCR